MTLMVDAKLLRSRFDIEGPLRLGSCKIAAGIKLPASLRSRSAGPAWPPITSALNLIYQVPLAERAVEEDHRERLHKLSRLQSTLKFAAQGRHRARRRWRFWRLTEITVVV
jgi:hypothetical protein